MRRVTAKTTARGKSARRTALPRLRLWQKRALTGLAALGGLGAVYAGLTSAPAVAFYGQIQQQAVGLSVRAGLRVEDIYVAGRQRSQPEHLLAALNVKRGDPILTIDLDIARQRLEALPWVASASIERRLPGQIFVTVAERQPVALWQHEGRFVLVDRDGEEIPEDVELFGYLPLIVGEGAPAHAAELFALLRIESDMSGRVKAAVRVGERRWTLKLDDIHDGIDIHLPEEGAAEAWRKFAEIERSQQLSAKDVTAIDMRLPDRIVLRTGDQSNAAEAAKAKSGKKKTPGTDA